MEVATFFKTRHTYGFSWETAYIFIPKGYTVDFSLFPGGVSFESSVEELPPEFLMEAEMDNYVPIPVESVCYGFDTAHSALKDWTVCDCNDAMVKIKESLRPI